MYLKAYLQKRKWLVLLFLLQQHFQAFAQSGSLYFEKINAGNGLSHNKVNCIVQDRRGFMWIGTDDGLNRFDGHNFTVYRNNPHDSSSLSGNIISGLLEDEAEILWITTVDGGLTRYDYRLAPGKQFKQFRHLPADSNSIPSNSLNTIIQDNYKNLWLATSGFSLLRFSKSTGKFERAVAESRHTFLALCTDAAGYIWAGGHGGGIFRVNPNNLRHFNDPRYNNLYAKLPHAAITSFYRDENDDIWFGSWDKSLYRYNNNTGTESVFSQNDPQQGFINDEIRCFTGDKDGHLWMGGQYNGLQLYDVKTRRFTSYQHDPLKEGSISDNHINCLFVDKRGVLWIGTNSGLCINDPAQQRFPQRFLPAIAKGPSTIHALYEDDQKNLFIGTNNGLFIRKKGEANYIHQPLFYKGHPLTVTCFFKDGQQLYLGTDYSLFVYDPAQHTVALLPNTEQDSVMNQIIESRVVSIIKDSINNHPVLLVSPYGHYLAYYDLTEQHWVSRLDTTRKIIRSFGMRDNLIHKFLKTSTGQLWLANANQGLGEWNKLPAPRITYHTNDPSVSKSLSSNHVFDILEEKQGNLWISTFGGGLHFFDNSSKQILHIPGSPNLLEGLQTDKKGNVWMIAAGELVRYEPQLKIFTSIKLPDLEKTGGIHGSLYRDGDGNLYAGGLNYFISFDPELFQPQRAISPVYFTDFRIFEQSYSQLLREKNIVLPYFQNSISVLFSAPDYSFSQPLRYAYMLQGAGNEWVSSGNDNQASFSNLPGGHYLFKVKVLNNPSGNDQIATLSITIIPPFWARWWFYALCILAAILIIYGIYRYRITLLKRQQAIRNKIARDLHDNMGSALSSISVYSQVAKIYNSRNEKEGLETVLDKMSVTSTEMIGEMNDILWAVNPRNDNMEKIFQRMESFARPLASAKSISLQSAYDPGLLQVNLSMEKRKNFYLIFKEAFTNIVKYSGATNVNINVKHAHKQIIFSINDDGKGFDTEQLLRHTAGLLSGNGLRNMQMRALEMNGTCVIESSQGKGTKILLQFPV